MSLHIRKGDKVVILAGKDKGKNGKVLRVFPSKTSVVVEAINILKKHVRRRSEAEPGGMREVPMPLNISNVALVCPHCDKGVRFHVKVADDKSKVRICAKCQREI